MTKAKKRATKRRRTGAQSNKPDDMVEMLRHEQKKAAANAEMHMEQAIEVLKAVKKQRGSKLRADILEGKYQRHIAEMQIEHLKRGQALGFELLIKCSDHQDKLIQVWRNVQDEPKPAEAGEGKRGTKSRLWPDLDKWLKLAQILRAVAVMFGHVEHNYFQLSEHIEKK